MYSDKKFFWLDKTSWDYTNFADWGIRIIFTLIEILAAYKVQKLKHIFMYLEKLLQFSYSI